MSFEKVVVAGGGVLGVQIALLSAYTAHNTTIWLRGEGSIERTKPKIERYSGLILTALEETKKIIGNPLGILACPGGLITSPENITEEDIDRLIESAKENFANKLHIELDLGKALKDADIVIESMSENPEAKIEVYTAMKDKMDEKTILCTNTSTMLPSRFAEYTGRPDRYLALHFANSIWRSNTAEVMGHAGTSPEVYNRVVEFAKEINMIPLQLHKEQPGYILNTMLIPMLGAAEALWADEVADPETIDLTWRLGFGSSLGPFQVLDIIGLETAYNINLMKPDADVEGSMTNRIGRLLKEKIDKGELGVNAGKGFYDYRKK